VNARHAAERATKSMLAQLAVVGATAYVSTTDNREYAPLVQTLGGFGAGALLAHYSRDNEREADALGMEYMARAGQNPEGMVGLMDILREQSRHKPSAIETMFATHPMSDERYATARQRAAEQYGPQRRRPLHRERYLDHTARLRAIKPAVESLQRGEKAMGKEDFPAAEAEFAGALKRAPEDYAGLVMMAKCQVALERPELARRYAEQAKAVYPEEAQASNVAGIAALMDKDYPAALSHLRGYERRLPGNPNTLFLQGVALEGMQNRRAAAQVYSRYLAQVQSGDPARHAYQRLTTWGYIQPAPKQQ
jgi:predicted Zn-dependent protease